MTIPKTMNIAISQIICQNINNIRAIIGPDSPIRRCHLQKKLIRSIRRLRGGRQRQERRYT